jgi:hypothetical protein
VNNRAAVPAWIADGSWYANNPQKLQLAIVRSFDPVTTPLERDRVGLFRRRKANPELPIAVMLDAPPDAREFVSMMIEHARTPTFACSECGRFAFPSPCRCYWCEREDEKWGGKL